MRDFIKMDFCVKHKTIFVTAFMFVQHSESNDQSLKEKNTPLEEKNAVSGLKIFSLLAFIIFHRGN